MADTISHDPNFWGAVETIRKSQQKKLCLAESESDPCNGRIVAAHTIPRNQLQQIAEDSHVLTLFGDLRTFQKTKGKLELTKKGVGAFSVLNCFCAHHDMKLFSPIENRALVFTPEQIACLHYRAIAAEVYRKMTAFSGFQEVIAEEQKGGRLSFEQLEYARLHQESTRFGIVDVGRTFKMCEDALFARKFGDISALVVRFTKEPAVMSVGGFSPQFDYEGRRLQYLSDETAVIDQISVSVLSSEGSAAVVFAWVSGAKVGKPFCDSLINQPLRHWTTLIIQTLFEHLENTCMRISWWDSLRPIERKLLTQRMEIAIGPEARSATALGYAGVTFDDWGPISHEFVNI